ncbi:hypothetical protein OQJ19_12470 [Fluoribacter gormanii]|uniref:Uncharacterized protein n=1 Tax=Fluoribacter gormanii TaxID=464 RepID=A0A377GKZ9_9GAMM|nr:hypothetical protein [Fluoribacter gormanii]KTD01802.1 hypothetical protein Lgor_2179 [Fluoribacter gormanii]MCW8442971.1 hypothetical protein [Fluoribacter gormanii]MCW8471455.1 hypothetical protein [Fluoribacter gormanii]SIR21216.1 hypothetical protein SAMN05421777_10846 [Fluoribacter gormanii]STO25428.1 Uncharacterised protein [Fluoribacter gormanii]
MNSAKEKDPYEARIKIEEKIISSTTGSNIESLMILLTEKCDLEHSGAEGEIIEIATGKVIYRCHKQTIIDQ